jgi:hypothetical protein
MLSRGFQKEVSERGRPVITRIYSCGILCVGVGRGGVGWSGGIRVLFLIFFRNSLGPSFTGVYIVIGQKLLNSHVFNLLL